MNMSGTAFVNLALIVRIVQCLAEAFYAKDSELHGETASQYEQHEPKFIILLNASGCQDYIRISKGLVELTTMRGIGGGI